MNIFLWMIVVLAGIIAVLLLIGLFSRRDYSAGREVIINKPKGIVFDYLKVLKNQNKWSVWGSMDPDMKTSYTGTDGTEGFTSAWESNVKNVGAGEQEILKIVEGERLDYEMRFLKPFKSTSWAYIKTTAINDNQTKVYWAFNGKMNYPANLMLVFMNMEKMIGNDFEKGLEKLKSILEK
jgi:uncharacterized protein YndB with AHSA1/START domain